MLHSCEREGDEFINESKIITVTNERGLFYHSIVLSIILDKIVKIDLKKISILKSTLILMEKSSFNTLCSPILKMLQYHVQIQL